MASKLLIVNNGLKDLTGHYFETSVSIADAARKLGLRPLLAAHVSCPPDLVPDWLDFYPLCCTDHWMAAAAPPPPNLRGLRGEVAALVTVTADAVLDGTYTVADYLRARLEPLAFLEEPAAITPKPEVARAVPLPAVPAAAPRLSRKARLKGLAVGLTPPVMLPGLRRVYRRARLAGDWTYQRRGVPFATAKAAVRAVLPPLLYGTLARLRNRLRRPAASGIETASATSAPPAPAPLREACPEAAPVLTSAEDSLQACLEKAGLVDELAHLNAYQRDLERLVCLTGVGRDDHVFMPTAHGRELLAVQRLVNVLGDDNAPLFHLEFRHTLELSEAPAPPHPYTTCHRIYFEHFRRQPQHPRIRLYTDTEELTEEYSDVSGLCFATVPVPFRVGLLREHKRRPGETLCLAYFGDVRDEKGFHWLPDLIDALRDDDLVPGKVRFIIQASLGAPQYNPKSVTALERLLAEESEHITLVGTDGPLSPEEYYRLFSETDLLLCPYDPLAYRRRSSGTFTEAIAAAIPTVVPRNTWLERHQPPGAGAAFTDLESFLDGVRRVCADYPRHLACARAFKDHWLTVHTPENLVHTLVRGESACPCQRALA